MNVNLNTSAANMIFSAQNKSAEAAQQIATSTVNSDETGASSANNDVRPGELSKPVTQLSEAELETSAAVKILETDQENQQALLDIHV